MNATTLPLARAADRLGHLRAEIDRLQSEARELETTIKGVDETVSVVEGDLFRVAIVRQVRSLTDWKGVAAYLKPSRQLIRAYTKDRQVTSLRVAAKTKAAA